MFWDSWCQGSCLTYFYSLKRWLLRVCYVSSPGSGTTVQIWREREFYALKMLILWHSLSLGEGLLGGSAGKEFACQCRRHGFEPWLGNIPWRRKWQPTLVFFPGKSHGQRGLVGYSPWGHIVGHDLATKPPPLLGRKHSMSRETNITTRFKIVVSIQKIQMVYIIHRYGTFRRENEDREVRLMIKKAKEYLALALALAKLWGHCSWDMDDRKTQESATSRSWDRVFQARKQQKDHKLGSCMAS